MTNIAELAKNRELTVEKVKKLNLSHELDLFQVDEVGLTAIAYAIINKDHDLSSVLMKIGKTEGALCLIMVKLKGQHDGFIYKNTQFKDYMSFAAFVGNYQAMQKLEELHEDPEFSIAEFKDDYAVTVMHHAARGGQIELMKFLVDEHGHKYMNKDDYGLGLMHYAAYGGHINTMIFLHDQCGIEYNVKDKSGSTAMSCAAFSGHKATMQFLYEKGIAYTEKNLDGETLMHFACKGNKWDTVNFLAKQGLAYDEADNSGSRPEDSLRCKTEKFAALKKEAMGLDEGEEATIENEDVANAGMGVTTVGDQVVQPVEEKTSEFKEPLSPSQRSITEFFKPKRDVLKPDVSDDENMSNDQRVALKPRC